MKSRIEVGQIGIRLIDYGKEISNLNIYLIMRRNRFIKDITLTKDTVELHKYYLTHCKSSNVLGKLMITKIEKNNVDFEVHMMKAARLLGFDEGDYPVMKAKGKIRKGEVYIKLQYGETVWEIANIATIQNYG